MKRATLGILLTLLPLTAAAQESTPVTAGPTDGTTATTVATSTDSSTQFSAPRVTKRRGSMVGYIEDPSLTSTVRVRFDIGHEMEAADRAEFFYAKCGCYRDLAGNAAYDPDAPGPGPGVLQGLDYNEFSVLGQVGLGSHVALFAEVPFRSISPIDFVPGTGSFGDQSGIGDVKAGAKLGLVNNATSTVTVMVRGYFPSGDSRKGLGTAHPSIEPALLFQTDLGSRAGLEGQFGYWIPTSSSKGPLPTDGDFAGDILYYGIGPSFDIVRNAKASLSPVVELVGWHVMNGYQTSTFVTTGNGDASGINVANLKIGARVGFGANSIYVGYGFALTDDVWYKNILRFEYRASF